MQHSNIIILLKETNTSSENWEKVNTWLAHLKFQNLPQCILFKWIICKSKPLVLSARTDRAASLPILLVMSAFPSSLHVKPCIYVTTVLQCTAWCSPSNKYYLARQTSTFLFITTETFLKRANGYLELEERMTMKFVNLLGSFLGFLKPVA